MLAFSTFVSLLASSALVVSAPIRRDGHKAAAAGAASPNDILVLKFAGVLERLETAFYQRAFDKFQDDDFLKGGFGDANIPKEVFANILVDEQAHTSIIEKTLIALGEEPVTSCKFEFGDALKDVATMAATARVVENVGVSAYLGAASLIDDKKLLVAAASIMTIEARHQAILNALNGATAIPSPFDIPLSPSQILAIAGGFISGCDLGIPALPSLSVTNTGQICPGTKLHFASPALGDHIDKSKLTCQMITGGATFALALPFDECVVPDINGPVYVFIVNGTQPLLNNQHDQFGASILAGPLLTFIDSVPDTLGKAIRASTGTTHTSKTISKAEADAKYGAADGKKVDDKKADDKADDKKADDAHDDKKDDVPAVGSQAAAAQTDDQKADDAGGDADGVVTVLGWSTSDASTGTGDASAADAAGATSGDGYSGYSGY